MSCLVGSGDTHHQRKLTMKAACFTSTPATVCSLILFSPTVCFNPTPAPPRDTDVILHPAQTASQSPWEHRAVEATNQLSYFAGRHNACSSQRMKSRDLTLVTMATNGFWSSSPPIVTSMNRLTGRRRHFARGAVRERRCRAAEGSLV